MSSNRNSTQSNRKSDVEDGEINEGSFGTTMDDTVNSRNYTNDHRSKQQRSGSSERNESRHYKRSRHDDVDDGYYRHHRRNSRERSSSQQRHSTSSRYHRDNDERRSHHRHRHHDRERHRSTDRYHSSRSPTHKDESSSSAAKLQSTSTHESRANGGDLTAAKDDEAMDYDLEDEEDEKQKEERLIEERRKRRQAILDKYKSNTVSPASTSAASPSNAQNLSLPNTPIHLSKQADDSDTASSVMGVVSPKVYGGNGNENLDQNSRDIVVSITDRESSNDSTSQQAQPSPVSPATKQELLRQKDHQEDLLLGEGIDSQRGMKATDYTEHLEQTKKPVNVGDEGFDMFATDLDIFAAAEESTQPTTTATTMPVPPSTATAFADVNPTLNDNWDDPEGYYNLRIGEILHERYQTLSHLGKGVFSSVVKAKDLTTGEEVAIKMIRNNETMYKAGQKELALLKKLMEADPDNKKHVIRLLRHFEHRSHLCLVFESLSMNLRDVLKKYGKDVGISIKAVRVYAQQLFLSLSLLKRCNLLHADIKPDNILVTESKNVLKLCDLGSASDASDNEITPYLVSRFYRAPEIILGLPYDYALDVWSAACTLYELFTGKILFPGRSNNQMLKYMMEVKGRFSNKMLRKSQFATQHFDDTYTFMSVEQDKLSGKSVVKKLPVVKPSKDIKSRIMTAGSVSNGVTEEENRLLLAFVDFLEKCLALTPDRRMTAKEALSHPFITGKT